MDYLNQSIQSSDQIISAAAKISGSGRKKMVAVAAAQDVDVIDALSSAETDGILDATLFGDKTLIEKMAAEGKIDISRLKVIDEKDPNMATVAAVKMAAEGKADIIMKGFISTSILLKTVLSKDFNLRTKNTLSHVAVLDIPGYHKLLALTDGGMVVKPDLDQKLQLLENAVGVARALGVKPIRVALSSAIDDLDGTNAATAGYREFIEKASALNLGDVILRGPLTLDAATSKEIAARKKLTGEVVGEADIFLMNTIEECNIVAKTLINFASTVFAGVIVGARVPVSLVSRTDTAKNKKASVALACLIAEHLKTAAGGRL
ncbi:MAG: phosphate acyltransferase [candidate division Zixibacteria bacterium]|nr:phosphate acyltransferase [candidate division Zixibacteria bacterium]